MVTFRLIWTSLIRERNLYLLWIVSLGAAVSGLMVIDVYRASLARTLNVQGSKILSADISLSSRRRLSESEQKKFRDLLPLATRYATATEIIAMTSSPKESRLSNLKFVDESYPLIGELVIEGEQQTTSRHGADFNNLPSAWAAPDLQVLLGVQLGDKIKIGQVEFVIRGWIKKDSTQTFRMGSIAPRIYLPLKFLNDTKLVQFGSTFGETLYAALPVPSSEDLKKKAEALLPDPILQVTVPADLEQGSLRVLSRVLDYLGLVGLVTLALGWIGVYYLGRRWLVLEQPTGGVLKALGLSRRELKRLWVLKLTLILLAGVVLGGALAWSLSVAVIPLFKNALPDDFILVWSWRSTATLLLVGPGMGWLLLSENIFRVARGPALDMVAGVEKETRSIFTWILFLSGLGWMGVALTFLQARSWVVTYSFLGALLGSLVVVLALGLLGLGLVRATRSPRQRWLWHTASALWLRRPALTLLLISVSALCGLLSQLIPHLEKTLVGELNSPEAIERPALFLFDVQDEQLQPIKEQLQSHGIAISQTSPFIRARLIKVNEEDFERAEITALSTREQEMDARLRNRGVNLSFREVLGPAEKNVEGKAFDALTIDPAEISVETGYADRMKIRLGDHLVFDVQGVEVAAHVANLRSVNWDSFEPNFFMEFKPGVIDAAPKTWIITVKRHPNFSPAEIQRLIAKDFPNATSINVQEAVDTISALLTKLGSGLRLASRLSLALGLFVFMMILLFQLLSSERDWIQLHRQGLTRNEIFRLQFLSYATLGIWGALLGSALSLLVCWGLARWTFFARPQYDWPSLFSIFILTCLLSIAALVWLSKRQFRLTQSKSRFDAI